jgi:small GTP-binding protein
MIQKKICMLGAFAVGKTSLVARYVSSMFSDKYLSTVGVKIDKKQVSVDGRDLTLMLWDIAGQDDFQTVQPSHLRGMAGYLLVADGTRRATLEISRQLQVKAATVAGPVPFILLLNKSDLAAEWEIDEPMLIKLVEQGWRVVRTSAKTGEGVESAFDLLARAMLGPKPSPGGEL